MTQATDPAVVMGTVGYMSPEQVDARSDIFSFGAVLHEMMTGEIAFRAPSSVEVMHGIFTDDPPELADEPIDRIVRRCLQKQPEPRFQTPAA